MTEYESSSCEIPRKTGYLRSVKSVRTETKRIYQKTTTEEMFSNCKRLLLLLLLLLLSQAIATLRAVRDAPSVSPASTPAAQKEEQGFGGRGGGGVRFSDC